MVATSNEELAKCPKREKVLNDDNNLTCELDLRVKKSHRSASLSFKTIGIYWQDLSKITAIHCLTACVSSEGADWTNREVKIRTVKETHREIGESNSDENQNEVAVSICTVTIVTTAQGLP